MVTAQGKEAALLAVGGVDHAHAVSTARNRSTPFRVSFSLRPRQGRGNPARPVMTWRQFSWVQMWIKD